MSAETKVIPMIRYPLVKTRDRERADRSRLIWGQSADGTYYFLSVLSLTNTVRRALGLPLWTVRR